MMIKLSIYLYEQDRDCLRSTQALLHAVVGDHQITPAQDSGGSKRRSPRGKEEMTEERKAGWASKRKPSPLLSSKSGSATA